MQPTEPRVRVTWHITPQTPAQLVAWRWLWARLLCPVDPAPKKEEPQDGEPGAATEATVTSGHNLWDDHDNGNISRPLAP